MTELRYISSHIHSGPEMIKWTFAIAFLLQLCSCAEQEEQPSRPNVIVIFSDDQGYQDLGCFGSPDIRTPHIDGIAANGAKLTHFYVSQPVCSASRASLLTGCYANRVGVNGAYFPYVGQGLHPEEETIAELLKTQGYATACFGKWHLGSEDQLLPTRQGFDEYFGIPYSNDMWPHHPTIKSFQPLPLYENEEVIDTLNDQSMITTWYTEKSVDFINRQEDGPFFLYLAHSMPHVPLFVHEDRRGTSSRSLYGDVIEEIDWSTGQILEALDRKGLTENTLIIFTSDNGPWLSYGGRSGEAHPLREGKGTAWEGGVRVPCVMQWPAHLPAGQVIDRPAMTIDLLPTIAGLCGADLPSKQIDGNDCWPLLSGESSRPHHDHYFFYYKQNELHAVLSGDGDWKLYFPHQYRSLNGRVGTDDGLPIKYDQNLVESVELYNLTQDIGENTDLAAAHPEIVRELSKAADAMRSKLGDKLTEVVGSDNRPAASLE